MELNYHIQHHFSFENLHFFFELFFFLHTNAAELLTYFDVRESRQNAALQTFRFIESGIVYMYKNN